MSPLFMPQKLLHKIVDKVKEKVKNEKPTVFNIAFLEGLDDLKNHPTNDIRYDKDICLKGWKDGKKECDRLDKIRGTDIKIILAIEPAVLEWWNGI